MKPNCHISERLKGSCDVCETWPGRLHMPEDVHGWYCEKCCPVCNPKLASRPRQAEPREQSEGVTAPQVAA